MGNVQRKSEVPPDSTSQSSATLAHVCQQLASLVRAHQAAHSDDSATALSEQLNTIGVDGPGWMRAVSPELQWKYTIDVLSTSTLCAKDPSLASVCLEVAQVAESFFWIALGTSRGSVDQKVHAILKAKISLGRSDAKQLKKGGEAFKLYRGVLDHIEESLDATMPMDGLTGTGFVEKLNVAKQLRQMPVDEEKNKKQWKKLLLKYHPDKQQDSGKKQDSTRIFQFMQNFKDSSKENIERCASWDADTSRAEMRSSVNSSTRRPRRRTMGICCAGSKERELGGQSNTRRRHSDPTMNRTSRPARSSSLVLQNAV